MHADYFRNAVKLMCKHLKRIILFIHIHSLKISTKFYSIVVSLNALMEYPSPLLIVTNKIIKHGTQAN